MRRFIPLLGVALMVYALSAQGAAAKIPNCKGGGTKEAKETARSFATCLKNNIACAGLHVQVFGNNEGLLPKVNHNEIYYEARVGEDGHGGAGARRLVFRTLGDIYAHDLTIQARYYSPDHYQNFCEM